ncbi:MAG: hypothetical protein IH851_09035 [Armatimonadetes bacterium]|nr:hypothetical protein [Armatimonadota bacterium]
MMNARIVAVLSVLALAGSLAFAQGGGGRMQRGGMGFQRGAMAGAGLLQRADVQKELKLTGKQKSEIQEKLGSTRGGRGGGGGGGGRGGFDPDAMAARAAEMDKTIKGILNASQYKRYKELLYQRGGAEALAQKPVADEVGLSQQQRTKIGNIQNDARQSMRDMFQGSGRGGDMQAMRERMEKIRANTGKKILAVLNSSQKKKWGTMQGKKFKFAETGR